MSGGDMRLTILDCAGERPLAPRISKATAHFWQALAEGYFEVSGCIDCEHLSFPPKGHCPACGSGAIEWRRLSGRARLYSVTTQYFGATQFQGELPLTLAILDTEEGVRLLTRLLDAPADPALDQRVELVVTRYADGPLFAARLCADEAN